MVDSWNTGYRVFPGQVLGSLIRGGTTDLAMGRAVSTALLYTAIAAVVQTISRRVIRKRRRLGYLETGLAPPVATGYDPLRATAPELARTMAASVQHRIAGGERAGPHGRRSSAGLGAEGEAPRLPGPRCASVHGFSGPATTALPAQRRDQGNVHPDAGKQIEIPLVRFIDQVCSGAAVDKNLVASIRAEQVFAFEFLHMLQLHKLGSLA